MLLEFKAKNYKTFKDELVFSMLAAPKQKGLDYSVIKRKIGSKKINVLSAAVVYGPNASGKTNIIGAMDTFKNIVLRGHIRNTNDKSFPNVAAYNLELIPNSIANVNEPSLFSMKFYCDEMLIEYVLEADLGRFLEKEYKRRIVYEELKIDSKTMFLRSDRIIKIDDPAVDEVMKKVGDDNFADIVFDNLMSDELFLINGYKSIVNAKIVSIITKWLENKFVVIYRSDKIESYRSLDEHTYIDLMLSKAANIFGASNLIGFAKGENEAKSKICTIIEKDDLGNNIAIPINVIESYGTVRFANMFPIVASVISKGGVLIVDEFDASIHPMALMSIINIFHDNEINVNGAQLIFNTHNPIFLNSNIFRRDEIKFVERDEETGYSTHYSLSDFGTSGENGVRKSEDYMKNYFISRYGAIRDIDFTDVFEEIIKECKGVEEWQE